MMVSAILMMFIVMGRPESFCLQRKYSFLSAENSGRREEFSEGGTLLYLLDPINSPYAVSV
jgi:hypothetical protein